MVAVLSVLPMLLAHAAPPPAPVAPSTVCSMPFPEPAKAPPAGSGPVLLAIVLCFEKQGGVSLIDPQTYLYYVQTRPSEPSRDRWVPYDDEAERTVLADFRRLWATNFLDDLAVDVQDYPFANGVTGKLIVFRMEERQRVKIVDFEGSSKVSRSDIEETLKKRGLEVRLDSFVDPSLLRKVSGAVRDLYGAKGFMFADVRSAVQPIEGSAKTVNVTFTIVEGPKVAIRDIEFLGNHRISDAQLSSALEDNKAQSLASLFKAGGTFNQDKYADDAERVVAYYRDRGYISARVGQPELRSLDDSADGRTRWIQLRIPVTEGEQYTIGRLTVAGNHLVASDALVALVKLKPGAIYSERRIRKAIEKARELYGAAGYFEFTGYPDLQPRDAEPSGAESGPSAVQAGAPPVVDVTIRIDEGQRYYVNRITFVGNTHTRDEVIRRELALMEAGVFNTEALKYSIRRLNQLGYFKPLESEGITVEKTPGVDGRVDIRLKLEEQNRNQVSFGAGLSQYEGFFGNASFTTSNFLGRGESVTFTLQKGTRSSDYSVGFTEPFLFNRPISAGVTLYSRKNDLQLYSATGVDYSEVRTGFTTVAGRPLWRFVRVYATYGYEVIETATSAALKAALRGSGGSAPPIDAAALLSDGRHTQSAITPSIVYNTVDNPQAPRRGLRLTSSYQYAGGVLGGTTNFIRPELESVVFVPVTRRTAFGVRANAGWIVNYDSTELPYYLRYALGGETQIRGYNLRSVGPLNASHVSTGGTKFVLFNAEYYYDIAPMVRALLFHDAGQAFDEKHGISLRDLRTSSGAELRVTLPMIGVPFRLIYAWNVYRDTSQPARTFKFAVGTTF